MSAPSHDAGSLTAVAVGAASLDRFGEILSGEQFEDMRAQIAEARRTAATVVAMIATADLRFLEPKSSPPRACT